MGSVIRIKTVPLQCTSSVISSYSPYTVHIRCLLRCNLLCVHHGSTPRTVQNRCHNVLNSLLPPDESYTLSLSPIHPNPLFLLYIIVLTYGILLCIISIINSVSAKFWFSITVIYGSRGGFILPPDGSR